MKYFISAILAFSMAICVGSMTGCAFMKQARPVMATIAVSECERLVLQEGRPELVVLCHEIPQLLERLVGEAKAGKCK